MSKFILLLAVVLTACSPVKVLNDLAPRDGVITTSDIPYEPGARHSLDVYAPTHATDAPVVEFIYGGNWTSGSKAMYRFVGAAMAAHGVVTVIPDYRLYPEVKFPAFVDDAAQATAWTRANIARFGGDPHRMFLMGHSAGGQIATLLALDPEYLQAVGLSQHDVCGVIRLAGPYDFLPLTDPILQNIFGPEADLPRSQPIHYVTPQAPPMLLLAGKDDTIVDPNNAVRLAARLRAAGVPVTDTLYDGITHQELIGAFSGALTFLAPARQAALKFVADHRTCD
jgi:acetyl esterase/lipase